MKCMEIPRGPYWDLVPKRSHLIISSPPVAPLRFVAYGPPESFLQLSPVIWGLGQLLLMTPSTCQCGQS